VEWTEFTSAALKEILVRPVERSEEARFQDQMARHHYLGALAKIGQCGIGALIRLALPGPLPQVVDTS
jgi:hypothetical protein